MRAAESVIWMWVNHEPGVAVRVESRSWVKASRVRESWKGSREGQSGWGARGVRNQGGVEGGGAAGFLRQAGREAAAAVRRRRARRESGLGGTGGMARVLGRRSGFVGVADAVADGDGAGGAVGDGGPVFVGDEVAWGEP